MTRKCSASAFTVISAYSQRPCRPGTNTNGAPCPRSTICTVRGFFPDITASVSEWFSGFQRVLDTLERFSLAAQREECLTLEIEQVLFADGRLVWQGATGQHVGERPADDRVVIGDTTGARREMDPELERGQHALAADRDCGSCDRLLIALAKPLECAGLRISHQALAVHGDPIGLIEIVELHRLGRARR